MKIMEVQEKSREYYFPNGDMLVFKNVSEVIASTTTHRLKTKDGLKHILPNNWICITIDSPKDWVDIPRKKKDTA